MCKQAEGEKAKKSLQHKAVTGKKRSREVTTETSTNEVHLNLVEGGSKITSRRTLHKRSKVTMDNRMFTQIYVVSTSVLLMRTKERAENGFSASVQSGFMKTVSYQTTMGKINFVPYVEL